MEKKEARILVPVDFSEQSKEGIYQAIQIANETGARVYLLHVIRRNLPPWNFMDDKERDNHIVSIEQALVKEAEELSQDTPPELSTIVVEGKLCDTILNQGAQVDAEMIVMGTSTAENIKKKIIGSNALRVATEAEIPVVTVKNGCASKNLNNIILPLDLTKETREKVTDTVSLAKKFHSKIFAVSFSSTRDEGVVGHLKGQLRQVKDFVEKSGLEIETDFRFYDGNRNKKFLEYVQERDGDLVIITTHQQPEIVRFFMGSFAKEVVHGSPVPVLSIVPKGTFKILTSMPGTD